MKKPTTISAEKKTYIIADDGYLSGKAKIRKFVGTHRQMLLEVADYYPAGETTELDEDDAKIKTVADLTDTQLLKRVQDMNGDGQAFYCVYCLEDEKQVL